MDFPLPNYPQPFGTRMINVTNHNGPLLYTTGGETVNASTFGWGSFDEVSGSASVNASNSGNFYVRPLYPVGQAANNVSGSNTVKLQWFTSAGVEASANNNLSLEYVRMEYVGG